MRRALKYIETYFLSLNLLTLLFGLSLSINLINYQSVDIVFTLFGLSALFQYFRSKRLVKYSAELSNTLRILNVLILVFIISCTLGYFFAGHLSDEDIAQVFQLRWVLSLYCCVFAGAMIRAEGSALRLQSVFFLVVILLILAQQLGTSEHGFITAYNRLKGFYENPNHLGLAMILPWAFYLGFLIQKQEGSKTRIAVQLLTFIGLSIAILATYSRTSWAAAAITFGIAAIYCRIRHSLYLISAAFLACGVLIFNNTFGIRDRLKLTLDMSADGHEAGRISAWKVNWQIFLDHPIFGVGIEKAQQLYPDYYSRLGISQDFIVGHAHNQYLQILSGAGIIGLASFLSIFSIVIAFFFSHLRSNANLTEKKVALGALLVISALLTSSFTDSPFRLHECRNYVLLILGVSFGYLMKTDKLSNNHHPDR